MLPKKIKLLSLFSFFAFATYAQKNIVGHLTGENGEPLANAKITLIGIPDEKIIGNSCSRLKGEFVFQMVPKGTYYLMVKKRFFLTKISKSIIIDDNDMEIRPLQLKLKKRGICKKWYHTTNATD